MRIFSLVNHRKNDRFNSGFTYIGLLIFLSIISISALAVIELDWITRKRNDEQELLRIGHEYRNALISYAIRTPQGQNQYPYRFEDLLLDPRFPGKVRHLRKIYVDPLTRDKQWGFVMSQDGKSIIGIFSIAPGKPLKIANFDDEFMHFKNKTTYRDWIFALQ